MKKGKGKKNILIVGGSGVIGQELVKFYDESGWNTAILSRNNDGSGGNTLFLKADLRLSVQMDQAIEELRGHFGHLNAVVFCAGMISDQLILKMNEEDWDEVLRVNLKGVFLLIQRVSPLLELAGGGHLICLGSIVGSTGRIGQTNYAAAKAGLVALVKSSARELGPRNIRVNVILPGFINSSMSSKLSEAQREKIKQENVLGRVGNANEVARFIHFLSTTDHISGQVFNLDSRILPGF